jgi:hypothetical protein
MLQSQQRRRAGRDSMSMSEMKAEIEAAAAAYGDPLSQLITADRAAPFVHPERLDLPSIFDQTLLKPELTGDEIDDAAEQALRYGFATVVVHPIHLKRLAARLAGSTTLPGSVVGFPYGANLPEIRAAEARLLIDAGARGCRWGCLNWGPMTRLRSTCSA